MKICLQIQGDFGAKTVRFTRVNMTKIGLLKIHIVLCSNLCQMLVDEKVDVLGLLSFFAVF